ncbi:MAG TPA: ABC transporter permease [Planctomycetaceae bacterium]|nr:ABC transporter permease [Planctomycetaceae bacterium]
MSVDVLTPAEFVPAEPRPGHPPRDEHVTVIQATSAWRLVDWRELYAYRDLFRFLTWRSIKVRYAQSAVGIGWAVIQPLFQMLIFTVVFGWLAGMQSDGSGYAVFSLIALVPWTYFANALTDCSDSLVSNSQMLSKVYFPRMVLPLSAVVAKLFDFAIAMALAVVLLIVYRQPPTWGVLMVPYLVLLMMIAALGLGLWLTTLAIQYRDVKHAMSFIVQILMYTAPVVYPTSLIPETYTLPGNFVIWPQWIYALNPMVGVIEGFRSAFLGTRPMPFGWIALGTLTACLLTVSGAFYFRNREKLFADVA